MYSPIDDIKNRLDLIDVIQGYLRLQKSGANYRALCPFHKEKTPSFFVSPERQIWHCFGCSKGGDMFQFIMEIESVEFREALQILANKAGVILKKESPALRTKRQRFIDINETATSFFEENLKNQEEKPALDYLLKERGLNPETIKNFRLGYAPNGWRTLKHYLLNKGFQEQELIEVGLVIKPETQGTNRSISPYDRFRNRIIFPIFSLNNEIIGFSGRVFDPRTKKDDPNPPAKYINSPNSLIYDKSRVLYGLEKARFKIREENFAVLVEGNLDVMMAHQANTLNVVATCGTSLNENHLRLLKRYSDNLKLCFDQDTAGDLATKRGIRQALGLDFNLKIIVIPSGKDPADLVLKDPKLWQKTAGSGKNFLRYLFDITLKENPQKDVVSKKNIAKELLPVLKALANKVEQAHWINELAEKLEIEEKYLFEALVKTKSFKEAKKEPLEEQKSEDAKSRRLLIEEYLTILALKYKKALKKKLLAFDEKIIQDSSCRKIIQSLKKDDGKLPKKDQKLEELLNFLSFKAEFFAFDEKKKILEEWKGTLRYLKIDDLKKSMQQALKKIKVLEKENKGVELKNALSSYSKILTKLTSLS